MLSQGTTAAGRAPDGTTAVAKVATAGWLSPQRQDAQLRTRLLAGDEDAFRAVVAAWGPGMLHVAGYYISSRASTEEVVQDTWIAVLGGLAGFQGRSSLKTWVFRVLVNTAKARALREARTVPVPLADEDPQVAAAPGTVPRPGAEHAAGRWTSVAAPDVWHEAPEAAALAAEARRAVADALVKLPHRQRSVVTLRDVYGYTSTETCDLLGLSPANQRVLLHRGRAALRDGLGSYYAEFRVRT
jgi:RNA polymerase sigma-70 factor (ECF subfamily)